MEKTKKLQAGNDIKTHAWSLTHANLNFQPIVSCKSEWSFSQMLSGDHGVLFFYQNTR